MKQRFMMVVLATLALATTTHAAPPAMDAPGFKALEGQARTSTIVRIETYLSSINSLTADFSQTSSDGSTGGGKFFMKRPGKIRWQYNPPTPLLLVSDGKTMTYYDPGVDQVSYIDVDSTLAGFLAKKIVKLDSEGSKLTAIEASADMLRATLVQAQKPSEGSLTIELTSNPLQINKIITKDATGNITNVTFQNLAFDQPLDDKLFVFNDTRSVNEKRNKRQ